MLTMVIYLLLVSFLLPSSSLLERICHSNRFLLRLHVSSSPSLTPSLADTDKGSKGIELLKTYLNSIESKELVNKLVLQDTALKKEIDNANFWSGSSFVIDSITCDGIIAIGIQCQCVCTIKNKKNNIRNVLLPFPYPVTDENKLKNAMIDMISNVSRGIEKHSADIVKLDFGRTYELPIDFRWNQVPHQAWVRSYVYDSAANAVIRALGTTTLRMQIKVNFPEVNPAYDTYRIGTILEMIRYTVLKLTRDEGKKVRICVQQSLGEGVFAGMPLALASMRTVLERMDWGADIDNRVNIRFGTIGADQVADDDDIYIIIAPQNVIGGSIVEPLEEMVSKATGKPFILMNPLLNDRPSSNGVMSIAGRADRRGFRESFVNIHTARLLYPSNGGYMYPIKGMLVQMDIDSLWVVYSKSIASATATGSDSSSKSDDVEIYSIIGAFPAGVEPSAEALSSLFTN